MELEKKMGDDAEPPEPVSRRVAGPSRERPPPRNSPLLRCVGLRANSYIPQAAQCNELTSPPTSSRKWGGWGQALIPHSVRVPTPSRYLYVPQNSVQVPYAGMVGLYTLDATGPPPTHTVGRRCSARLQKDLTDWKHLRSRHTCPYQLGLFCAV